MEMFYSQWLFITHVFGHLQPYAVYPALGAILAEFIIQDATQIGRYA